jgi:hypothetical protein
MSHIRELESYLILHHRPAAWQDLLLRSEIREEGRLALDHLGRPPAVVDEELLDCSQVELPPILEAVERRGEQYPPLPAPSTPCSTSARGLREPESAGTF